MLSRRVLIIEDDADAAGVLEAYLRRENYDVTITGDGHSGLDMAQRWKPDLILLDVMLPGLNGTEVLAGLRRKSDVPVIMVTAMGDTPDRIGALRYGADDYVVKPYHPGEVVARVQAVLRRSSKKETDEAILRWQTLEVDVAAIVASVDNGGDAPVMLDLTPTEFSLLATLLRSPAHPFSRQYLLEHCLPESEALERVVAQHQPRALYINTALQNPSGASIGMANAFRILQVAERHGLWVIEDDISRDLAPGVTPMLAALDGARRVIYLGGYSKVISPSVRVGYVVAHRDLARDIARTKMAVGLTSPEIMERIVHQVIREGRYRAHIARTRERLAEAHTVVAGQMQQHGFEIHGRPQGGLFLWAKVAGQWRERGANGLAELALKDGIWLAPGSYFEVDEADTPWVRFNVAYSEAPALWRFMRNAGAA